MRRNFYLGCVFTVIVLLSFGYIQSSSVDKSSTINALSITTDIPDKLKDKLNDSGENIVYAGDINYDGKRDYLFISNAFCGANMNGCGLPILVSDGDTFRESELRTLGIDCMGEISNKTEFGTPAIACGREGCKSPTITVGGINYNTFPFETIGGIDCVHTLGYETNGVMAIALDSYNNEKAEIYHDLFEFRQKDFRPVK